jgi:hypothetical protein
MNQDGNVDKDINEAGYFTPLTFKVSRRLTSLAHRLGKAAPIWDGTTKPQHSVTKSTKSKLNPSSDPLTPLPANPPSQTVRDQNLPNNFKGFILLLSKSDQRCHPQH